MRQPGSLTYRRHGLRALRALVTLALTAWLVYRVDWAAVVPLLSNLRWAPIAGALASLLLSHLANLLRWHYLLDRREVGYGRLLRWYALGLFGTNILPTGIGGDAVRAALAGRVVPLGRAVLAVALDRAIGLIALSALIALGVASGLPPGLAIGTRLWPAWAVVAMLLGLGALTSAVLFAWKRQLLPRLGGLVAKRIDKGSLPDWRAGEWLRRLSGAYLISVPAHLGIVAANLAVLAALGVAAPWPAAVWLVILSSLSLLLPVSINGIGVVESVYVLVLGSYGVGGAAGLSVALAVRLLGLAISLLGGLALLERRPAGTKAWP